MLKTRCTNWKIFVIAIALLPVLFCVKYLERHHPSTRTSLELDRDRIESIDLILRLPDGASKVRTLEIPPWVDFFNSLELTYQKDGWIMYNRPGTNFVIYYIDDTKDTIRFHFGHLIYNGDFYDIDNHEGKTDIHDKLLGIR